ncbi:phage major capsid protein [Arsukibacterium sp.]|uniref:phage major capsid protein n=1 Tax=Arsukibacterium sp. TaxID=1977258 RepID=UPI00299E6870|nr:phage major capsid protein [Arsukibacterium sp.]MDX1538833.1 phage major capsid protein [Arsukibacterium sp.]
MPKLHELQQKRNAIAMSMRQLNEKIGDKSWSPEQRSEWDQHKANYDEVDQQISREEHLQGLESRHFDEDHEQRGQAGKDQDNKGEPGSEYRSAFEKFMRNGHQELTPEERSIFKEYRAQSSTVAGKGGETIPTEFRGLIVDKMKAYGGIANICQLLETDKGNPMEWVITDGTNDLGDLVGESEEAAEGDVTFSMDSLGAKKLSSKIIRVPNELLQDNSVNMEAYLAQRIASRIGRKEAQLIVQGTGAGTPQQNKGLVVSTTLSQVAAAVAAISAQDFLNLKHKVDPAYRTSARFAFNDTTLLLLKSLKDSQGRPLWLPSIAGVAPSTIDGDQYTIDQAIANVGASGVSAFYGDFSKFVLRRIRYMTLKRLVERYAEFDQTAFLAFHRFDTVLEDTSAIAKLAHPAS